MKQGSAFYADIQRRTSRTEFDHTDTLNSSGSSKSTLYGCKCVRSDELWSHRESPYNMSEAGQEILKVSFLFSTKCVRLRIIYGGGKLPCKCNHELFLCLISRSSDVLKTVEMLMTELSWPVRIGAISRVSALTIHRINNSNRTLFLKERNMSQTLLQVSYQILIMVQRSTPRYSTTPGF